MTTGPAKGTHARPSPHIIVLFGATGDLAKRKLLPGLYHLFVAGLLPEKFAVIGTSPPEFAVSEDDFRKHARSACDEYGVAKPFGEPWDKFVSHLTFARKEFQAQVPEPSYRPASIIVLRMCGISSALITRSPVAGLTPLFASVAPIRANCVAFTPTEHCFVYTSTDSNGSA